LKVEISSAALEKTIGIRTVELFASERKEKISAALDDVRKRNGDPQCSMRGNRGEVTFVETNAEE
jgi:hypothetical protein